MNRAMYAIPAVGLLWTGCGGVENNAECGDGVLNAGEACDDGNDVDGDACTNACTLARCGDGIVNEASSDEDCDDGNDSDNDDCTNACEEARCGDGIVHDEESGDETCDDDNAVENDGCFANCEADPILRSFLLTKRVNVSNEDRVTPYSVCVSGSCYGYGGTYTTCTGDFNSPVVVSMATLMANGMYSLTRTCENAAANRVTTRQITGNVSVLTPRTQYRIFLNEGTDAFVLTCDMDSAFKLTCLDNFATPRSWEFVSQ